MGSVKRLLLFITQLILVKVEGVYFSHRQSKDQVLCVSPFRVLRAFMLESRTLPKKSFRDFGTIREALDLHRSNTVMGEQGTFHELKSILDSNSPGGW